jgi:hypothetical protein
VRRAARKDRPPKGFSCWRIGLKCDWSPTALKKETVDTERLLVGGPWTKCKRCGFARRMTPEEIERNMTRGLAIGSAMTATRQRAPNGRFMEGA